MSREVSVLELDKIINVLQRRCESMNVTLKWDKHAQTACTNGKDITIPAVTLPVTKEAMDKLYGFVIHEAGHHSRPEAFDILNAVKNPSEALCAIYNIVEDDGMERSVAEQYNGDAIALGMMNNVILKELTEQRMNQEWGSLTEQDVAPMVLCSIGQLSRMEWDGMSTASRAGYMNALPPEAKKLMDTMVKEGYDAE